MKNSKKQGDAGLGIAINWFTQQGWTVNLPLTDSQQYDLIVDDGNLKRVQVRTTRCKDRSENYCLNLRVTGGNRSGYGKTKKFNPGEVELLFAVTQSGDKYLIPSCDLNARTQISLGEKWAIYKI